ncbi:MAG TPA: hypothetical protein VF263_12430 [Longimicrobiaceae bacterium]
MTTTSGSECSADPREGCYIVGTCNVADAFQSCHEQEGGTYGGNTGGNSTGSTGGTGTGGGGTPGDSWNTTLMDAENWDCHSDPRCDKKDPSQAQRDKADLEARKIKADKDPVCARIQANALSMLGRHFQVWSTRLTATREDGTTGTLAGDVYWTESGAGMHLWEGAIDAVTIAHEAMHGMYWQSTDLLPMSHGGVYGGRSMKEWENFCTT